MKAVLSALLLLCLLIMPYFYYQFVRYVAMVGFSVLAYYFFKNKKETQFIIYLSLALLFQPMWKIALGRNLWNTVDIVVALWLLLSLFYDKNKIK